MRHLRTTIISAVFVVIMLGAAVWLYPQLPAMTPTHWGVHGHANGWMPRFWAAAVPVLIELGLAVLLPLLPRISPRRFEIRPFARIYSIIVLAIQAIFLVIGIAALLAGAGHQVPIPVIATVAVGALFMVLGNYMGKLRKNFFVGIRTPWTLTSDVVWERTHRLAGWLFVLAGLGWIGFGLASAPASWLIAIVLAAALIPCVYSYFIYQRLEGNSP